ncbi:MAG: proline--tRNA ligase, partial [Candidatus Delongbacteria bacterium]|nr:proline--tRNA ligase [Candidatus Delongbacteria bacterium]
KEEFAWTTSWGVSTRLIGALIMSHADDNGMVIPPRVASAHVIILPIYKNDEEREKIFAVVNEIKEKVSKMRFHERRIVVKIDDRDIRGGEKNWHWIKKGAPIKVEIGPKDLEKGTIAVLRRDEPDLKKSFIAVEEFLANLINTLDDMQNNLYNKAKKLLNDNTFEIDDYNKFKEFFTPKNVNNPEIHGGFSSSHWCGSTECEEKAKEFKVTIRNIPSSAKEENGKCIICGKESNKRVIFAKAY